MLTWLLTSVAGGKSNNKICFNHNPSGYEFGRVAATKSAEVLEHDHS
jgi:hypothetical protein